MTELPDRRSTRKKPPRKTSGGGTPNKRRLAEARATTANRRSAARIDAQPVDVVQETLDGMVADLRFAQKMVDGLPEEAMWRDTMVGRIPNEWIRLRNEYRDRTAHFAGRMIERGIAEKAVNVSAAQTALMATMIKEAAIRAGLDPDQVTALGDQLRLLAIEAQTGDKAA